MTPTHSLKKSDEGQLPVLQYCAELGLIEPDKNLISTGGVPMGFSHTVRTVRISLVKSIMCCVAVLGVVGYFGGNASAQIFNVTPPPGLGPITYPPNVVTNASVINLYMASNWDAVAPPGETKEAIDSWTQALIGSSYFTFAGQYGIGTPHFVGGFNTWSGCDLPPTTGVVSTWDVGGFVNCNLTTGPLNNLIQAAQIRNIAVNVFLDPAMTMGTPWWGGGTCPGSAGITGYHDANQDLSTFLQPFTVIPANPACNGNFNALTGTLAHEMIELMTDPIGMDGWVHRYGPGGINIAHSLNSGEVGDICAAGGAKVTATSGAISFLGALSATASAASYWSNSAQACVPAWPFTTPKLAAQPVTIHEDSGTVTLSISGSGFGNAYAALQSASASGTPPDQTQNTPYFLLTDSSQGFIAGNSLSPRSLALSWGWSDGQVSMQLPGSKFFSCDNLTFTIWNPADGNSVPGSTTLPAPAALGLGLPAVVPVDSPVTATISVIPAQDTVLVTPTKIDLQVDGGAVQELAVTGSVGVPLTFGLPLGAHTVTVSTKGCSPALSKSVAVSTGPSVDSIFPDHGPATGGNQPARTVTINGHGLSQTTAVNFGAQKVATLTVINDNEVIVTTPPATPGRVPVSLTASGIQYPYPGQSSQLEYTFFDPGVPLLTRLSTCQADFIGIQAWGQPPLLGGPAPPMANAVISVKANQAFLRPPVIRVLDSNGTGQLTAIAEQGSGQPSVTVTMGLPSNTAGAATIDVDSTGECPWWGVQASQINPANIIQSLQGCPACGFSDVPATNANIYIYAVAAWGLMGATGKKFQPNAPVSRDQLVATLQHVAGPRVIETSQRVFGAISTKNSSLKRNVVRRDQAMRFLDASLQRRTTRVINPGLPFTRADLARALWLYAREAIPKPVTPQSH